MVSLRQRLTSNKLLLSIALLILIYGVLRGLTAVQTQTFETPGEYFDYQNYAVRYVCQGQNAPFVIFETGFGSDSEQTWSPIFDKLAESPKSFTACYYDRLGHGGSADVPTDFTTDDKSQLQQALIKHIAKDQPVVLVAKSYGGIIARRTLARNQLNHQINLQSLILLDSAHENQHGIMRGKLDPISDSVKNWQYANALVGFTAIKNLFKHYDNATDKRVDHYYSSFRYAHVLSTYRNEKGFYTPLSEFNYDFGDLKLVVLSHDPEAYANNPRLSAVSKDWAEMQASIAALSKNSVHIVVKGSTHNMSADAPDFIVAKVLESVDEVATLRRK
ncbi:alpha/beta hydrolase [Psychrosphaera ytuae]|uniref:Alpha/beta hydrolase n=1 Tax=Psychrosphaera ytuae TaxID=2820710 RepID=A0A975DCQ1_9GAMM|nr:alpha/beta hydrolase [Psychrosphaera ytuae]QTH64534.1 alpha/beta hydrolase [Psychrosphaera ytuae]